MSVIGTEPIFWKPDAVTAVQRLSEAQNYTNWNSTRHRSAGRYPENIWAFTRVLLFGNDYVFAYVGKTIDAGIWYNYLEHTNVQEALRDVAIYKDFYGALNQLGYPVDNPITVEATERLQEYVNLVRGG